MRLLGFVFVALLLALGIVGLDYRLSGTYLASFLDNHFIETFAALAGFNIAAVVFLVGQLLILEDKRGTEFESTRREIKHSSYFLLAAFVICLLLLIFRPVYLPNAPLNANLLYYGGNVLVIMFFELAIFAIFEILQAVFILGRTLKVPQKTSS